MSVCLSLDDVALLLFFFLCLCQMREREGERKGGGREKERCKRCGSVCGLTTADTVVVAQLTVAEARERAVKDDARLTVKRRDSGSREEEQVQSAGQDG